jgi:hypothetical protein
MRCILQESNFSPSLREDHQGRFRKLQAESLPRLGFLGFVPFGELWLAQIHFLDGEGGERFAGR